MKKRQLKQCHPYYSTVSPQQGSPERCCPERCYPERRHPYRLTVSTVVVAATLFAGAIVGCHVWPLGVQPDRTTMITPAMRMSAIREMAPNFAKAEPAEQQRACQQLAQQIQTEPDPLVRKAIQETIAEFQDPLAAAVLLAGLEDDHREVRMACCRKLAERKQQSAVPALRAIIAQDDDVDVRLAAVQAVGQIGSTDGLRAIALALEDNDPALQYAGVSAMREASGEDLGNDVVAWRQYAANLPNGGELTTEAIAAQPDPSTLQR